MDFPIFDLDLSFLDDLEKSMESGTTGNVSFEPKSEHNDEKTKNNVSNLLNGDFDIASEEKPSDNVNTSDEKKPDKSENDLESFFDGFMYLEELFKPFDDVKFDTDQTMNVPTIPHFRQFKNEKKHSGRYRQ